VLRKRGFSFESWTTWHADNASIARDPMRANAEADE